MCENGGFHLANEVLDPLFSMSLRMPVFMLTSHQQNFIYKHLFTELFGTGPYVLFVHSDAVKRKPTPSICEVKTPHSQSTVKPM